jgi:hypothetical protein
MGKLLGSLFGAGMPDFNGIIEGAYEVAAQGFFLYGIIGGLIALVFLLVINLVSYCRPKTLLFKIFNIINFIYIPFLLAFVIGSYGAWNFSKKNAVGEIHDNVLPAIKLAFPVFQLYLNMNEDELRKDKLDLQGAVLKFSAIISISTASATWIDQQKVAVAKKEIPLMLYRGIAAVVQTEKEEQELTAVDELTIASGMSFFKLNPHFWDTVEINLTTSTKNYFQTKLMVWLRYSLLASSFLILQMLLLMLKKKR